MLCFPHMQARGPIGTLKRESQIDIYKVTVSRHAQVQISSTTTMEVIAVFRFIETQMLKIDRSIYAQKRRRAAYIGGRETIVRIPVAMANAANVKYPPFVREAV